ncbi:D-2-hydroxyacid dehydrogenase [Phaeodactylibacter luteus]|uniref:3-phosphoglycerate dehydrogenase n=1 Tax=Phaeodactylibacter luteus TaxID=1564516 RepID=A0A5C6RHM4_9BACT|nr:D-2-hydroxyacid dehydrogenase [Phaeodactylibacter luteus]TXB61896.1 3-phosphoglycerate dehydrogenase [Phaeodactylibacter luteus]
MVKILATDGLHQDGITLLEEAGYQVDIEKVDADALPAVLPGYDVVIVRSATKIRQELIDLCPNLKIIARAGVGLDNIDAEYARSKGITVMNTPAASSRSVAELVFGHIFSLSRNLHRAHREMPTSGHSNFKELKKQCSNGTQVFGRTLGIVGFGRIGQEVARIGVGLGMKVMPVDLVVNQADIGINVYNSGNVRLSVQLETYEWEEVLSSADFLTIHVPFHGGAPIIGEEHIAQMKDGAVLINTARGGAIDEKALLKGLNSGKLRGAALDVYENEPTPMQELLEHPNVSCSPHIGASTLEARANIGLELADKILAFFGDDK